MAKLTDMQIKAWIKNGIHFEGKSDGNGLFLCYRATMTIPVWHYRYRFVGNQRRMQIGRYNQLSLAEARKKVKELAALVSLGHDVAADKQEKKKQAAEKIAAKANAFTVRQLADKYLMTILLDIGSTLILLDRRLRRILNLILVICLLTKLNLYMLMKF